MYIPKKTTTLISATANPLLLHTKRVIRSLSGEERIVFLLKYIKYTLNHCDTEEVIEGLNQLCVSIPELENGLRITNRTDLGEDEGERVYLLFKHAFMREENTEETPLLWRKQEPSEMKFFSS